MRRGGVGSIVTALLEAILLGSGLDVARADKPAPRITITLMVLEFDAPSKYWDTGDFRHRTMRLRGGQ